jgi:transcriptional regulator with XRE-family HTH domain
MKIRDMREDHDLTQQQIAEYLQCDQSLYSKYEREERDVPLHIMVKLAVFYKTSVDYLVGLTNKKTPYPRIKTKTRD